MHRLPALSLVALATSVLASACVRPDKAAHTQSGKELFAICVSCHGQDGQGMASVGAPPIAGMPAWYVESQLHKFRTDARGAHPDDFEGLRMRPMSRQLMNEAELITVAEYVASLPHEAAAPTLSGGNASAGVASFAACTACHGAKGEGNKALNAPPIAGQADWYLLAQLKKFKAGIRGANAKDTTGAAMRPMAMMLANEQAMLDVLAHLDTLAK